jgi:hypothetical protein
MPGIVLSDKDIAMNKTNIFISIMELINKKQNLKMLLCRELKQINMIESDYVPKLHGLIKKDLS